MSFVNFMRSMAGRLLRVVAGAAIIWLGLNYVQTPWNYLVAAIGLVPIGAGLLNLCLIGPLFHVDLRGRPKQVSQLP